MLTNASGALPAIYRNARFLRYGFASDRKTLKIIPETVIRAKGITFTAGTGGYTRSMAADITKSVSANGGSENGRDFYVFLVPADNSYGGDIVASLRYDCPNDIDASYTASNTLRMGMFSTLCADAGSMDGVASENNTLHGARIAVSCGTVSVGSKYCRKNYINAGDEADFYDFYNLKVVRNDTGSHYDCAYTAHPLSNFEAGDILPESVWCLSWHIWGASHRKGLVYEKDCHIAAGIYLQSGTGRQTASKYGAANTRSRAQVNHREDMATVGMCLLRDDEFSRVAQGSNEQTAVKNANEASSTTSGGSVDTQGRRMISDIGCEDCCGKINQWLADVSGTGGSGWSSADGRGALGQQYGSVYGLRAGGGWAGGSGCGSRSRGGDHAVSGVSAHFGGRECREVSTDQWPEFLVQQWA